MSIKICFEQTESMFFDFLLPSWLGGKNVVNPAGCTSKQKIKKAKPRNKAYANYTRINEHKDLFHADRKDVFDFLFPTL